MMELINISKNNINRVLIKYVRKYNIVYKFSR